MTQHYQDDIRLSTHSCTRDTQEVEGGDNISRIRIQIYRRTTQLQNRNRNNVQRMRSTHGHRKAQQQLQEWEAEMFQL